jgi:polysaccharide biosynthesis protein PslH
MNILILCSTFPYPTTKGRQQLRTFQLLRYLHQRHQVTLLTRRNPEMTDTEVANVRKQVTELVLFDLEQKTEPLGLIDKAKRLGKFIQQKTPPEILDNYSAEMAAWIEKAVAESRFEAIACEDSADEIYLASEWQQQLKVVLNLHFSAYGRYQQLLAMGDSENELKDQINLGLQRRYAEYYLAKFNAIATVNSQDQRLVKKLAPESKVTIIPNGVDLTEFPRRPTNQGEQRIVFVGSMDSPVNIDAAKFLALEVFPAIRQRYPEAILKLVGVKPVAEILELDNLPRVEVTGEVSSVVEYLHWATVCVIPIRQGYGLRNRTLEAMAVGVPIVASDRAVAEFEVDGANVPLRAMRANTLEEYIYAIGRLFSEPKLRDKLSENGRSLVTTEYTWDKIAQKYEQVLIN